MTGRDDPKRGLRGTGIAVCALAALALVPAPARADPPSIDSGPTITGTPQVGRTLQASATYEGNPSWRWYRCNAAVPNACSPIPDATSTTYTAVTADRGSRLRVLLTVRYRGDTEWDYSDPTGVVAAADPATPTPTPAPSATPTATPAPAPSATPTATPTVTPASGSGPGGPTSAPLQPSVPVPQGAVLPAAATKPATMMRPAPVVRIRGRLTRSGARITLLTVRAPRGARIALRCFGRGCPAKRWAGTASLTRIARFQGVLPARTRLVIRVTKRGRIGKHTTIVIRRGAAPTRRDRCLLPGSSRPVSCKRAAA